MAFYIILSVFFGWLIILSYYVFKTRRHYFNLTERTKKRKIDDILDSFIAGSEQSKQDILLVKKEVNKIISDSTVFYKRIGLVRYNPFGKTEGEQSFILSLLDGNDSGIVLNFIYTHEGIRIYAKKVKSGKGEEHQLSEEEKQAVKNSKY